MSFDVVEQVTSHRPKQLSLASRIALPVAVLALIAVITWQAMTSGGHPDPLNPATPSASAVLDIGILVFREGLECVLVIAAITASLVGTSKGYRRPITLGIVIAAIATVITWNIAVGIVVNLSESFPALRIQVITGIIAIVVLLIVMNWFFHKVYWTGWISMHTSRKRDLMKDAGNPTVPRSRLFLGFVLLGFTSLYREGFEVVLFLQPYRLKLSHTELLEGLLLGLGLSAIVAVLAFVANHRLPFRKMLVATGVLLGVVLLVMIGEQAQEMQLANWIPTTPIAAMERIIPDWMGLWFAVFPTVETLAAQGLAALLVVGSYVVVRTQHSRALKVARTNS